MGPGERRWGRAAAAVLAAVTIGGGMAGCGGESEAEVLCGKLDQGVVPAVALSEMPGANDSMEAARAVLARGVGHIRATCPQHEGVAQGLEFLLNPVVPPHPPFPEPAPAPVAAPTPSTTTARPTTTTRTQRRTAAECDRIANSSSLANADLFPYLRQIGCGAALDAAQRSAEQEVDPCDRPGTCGADGEGQPDPNDGTDEGLNDPCLGPDADVRACGG